MSSIRTSGERVVGGGQSVSTAQALRRLIASSIVLLIAVGAAAGCAPGTPSLPASGLAASSSGVCEAIAALPDTPAAERAFTNVAHDALHRLAADPRLERSLSARVLERMATVEADFNQSRDVAMLPEDLEELRASADAALRAIHEQIPECAR